MHLDGLKGTGTSNNGGHGEQQINYDILFVVVVKCAVRIPRPAATSTQSDGGVMSLRNTTGKQYVHTPGKQIISVKYQTMTMMHT